MVVQRGVVPYDGSGWYRLVPLDGVDGSADELAERGVLARQRQEVLSLDLLEQLAAAHAVTKHRAVADVLKQFGGQGVDGLQRVGFLIAKPGEDSALGHWHGHLHLRLVLWALGSRGRHGRAMVRRHRLARPLDHRRARDPAEALEATHVTGDELRSTLGSVASAYVRFDAPSTITNSSTGSALARARVCEGRPCGRCPA
jgi:hypothetical protein